MKLGDDLGALARKIDPERYIDLPLRSRHLPDHRYWREYRQAWRLVYAFFGFVFVCVIAISIWLSARS